MMGCRGGTRVSREFLPNGRKSRATISKGRVGNTLFHYRSMLGDRLHAYGRAANETGLRVD